MWFCFVFFVSGIGKVVMALSKHPDETVDNKAKLKEIIDKWSRIITGTHQHSRKAIMVRRPVN